MTLQEMAPISSSERPTAPPRFQFLVSHLKKEDTYEHLIMDKPHEAAWDLPARVF